MRIIIEGYRYRAGSVRHILQELSPLESVEHEISINYVGYYYSPHLRDCIFILPKVLLNKEDKVFGEYDPHGIINVEGSNCLKDNERRFLYEFAVWIYRSIVVYNKLSPENDIVYRRQIAEMGKGKRVLSNTFLDVLLSLLSFNKEQQHFFITVLRNTHSGNNKINWIRTVNKTTAIIQNEEPVYISPVNKKREINYEEELLVIYFSILDYIHQTYGFSVSIGFGFKLIRGKAFAYYLSGFGIRRLKQIKYRYFSDTALRLWELCYAFFDKAHRINIVAEQREYLLVKNYNIVFESIIDELIGDKDIPEGLKDQEDGKRVDHLYSYQSLISNENEDKPVYYIGDSKYYKAGNPITKESVYKQFTYARNVIQNNLNLFLNGEGHKSKVPKYRDDETEGYNIIPNFFVSAMIDEDLSYRDNVSETDRTNNTFVSRQFENRLFDRDTLLVYHYDVNFLYVVSLYARENEVQKRGWRDKVRSLFRCKIQEKLETDYKFYAMTPKSMENHQSFMKLHFQEMLGKVYKPYQNPNHFALALDAKDVEGNKRLLETLQKGFYIEPCKLGEDPSSILPEASVATSMDESRKTGVLMVMMEQYANKSVKFLSSGKIAIGVKTTKKGMDIIRHLDDIGYILFHTYSDEGQHLYAIQQSPKIIEWKEIEQNHEIYAHPRTCDIYLAIEFDAQEEINNLTLHSSQIRVDKRERYNANYCKLDEIMKSHSELNE